MESGSIDKAEQDFRKTIDRAVNPSHYQDYLIHYDHTSDVEVHLQWLETQCRIARWRDDPIGFVGALELMIRKYMDRNGKKDNTLQELEKGLWYYKFMVAYIKNNYMPILVRDVDAILARK
jgi:hypothetical protein